MINEDRKKLYDALSSEYDLGTYEEFERNIGDSVKRRKLYDAASADYDLGDYENYSQKIGPTHKESLDAFELENGAWLNDFEVRDTAERKVATAQSMRGVFVPAQEGMISADERTRYFDLKKQEDALKQAYYTSDEYLSMQGEKALQLAHMRDQITKDRLAHAQANPVIAQEGLFKINPYAVRGGNADAEQDMFETASRIMNETIKLNNAPSRYENTGVANFFKGSGDKLTDAGLWTAGLSEITDNLNVRGVLSSVQNKLGNLNDLSEEKIEEILTPAEKAVLQAWAINAQTQVERAEDLSRGYQAGQGAVESLGFMAEFALTGGVGKAATEGTEAMAKWLGKKALTRFGGMADEVAEKAVKEFGEKVASNMVGKYAKNLGLSLAEAAGRTAVMPSTFRNITEKATEIETDENGNNYLVSMNDAFAKGLADSFIENLSEGGRVNALGELVGDIAGKIPAYAKIVDKFSHTKVGELYEALQGSGIMNTLRAGGWHGLGEEYLEEWYGNTLRTLTGVDKEALKEFATVDNQIVTISSFLPMTIFGGTVSTAQVLSANKDLTRKAEALKSALMERGYDEDQANNMIDMMRGATPAEVSSMLSPIVTAVAGKNVNEAAALMRPVGEFAKSLIKWQSFGTKYNYQEQDQRDAWFNYMNETLGKFWQDSEDGQRRVQRGVNAKGEVAYLLGKPSAEDPGATVAAVNANSEHIFVNPSDYQLEDELDMNDFLGNEIMAEKRNKEQARMVEEREAKIAQIRQQVAPGLPLNIGTEEAPVQAVVMQVTADGAIVTTGDQQARLLSWDEIGNVVGINAKPMTDEQLDEAESETILAQQDQRDAELDEEYGNVEQADAEVAESEADVEIMEEAANPLPTKADGSVDQTALWNTDPVRWAKWNDEQRQDGGANSLGYINGAIAKESAALAEMQAAYEAESDFDARDAMEAEINKKKDRLNQLTTLQNQYVAAQQAAAAPAVEAAPAQEETVAPRVSQQMSEEEKAQMDAQYENVLKQTRIREEKARLLQEYLSKLAEGSIPAIVLTADNYAETMRKNGCSEGVISVVTMHLENGENIGGFMSGGKIFLMADGLPSIEEARVTYVHERQHALNRTNRSLLQEVADLLGNESAALEIIKTFVGSANINAYKNDTLLALADEVIARCMEIAYTTEDFSVDLQSRGVPSELISIITEIDNEQRKDQSLLNSRRGSRRDSHADVSGTGSLSENGADFRQVSGGVLDNEETRPSGISEEGISPRSTGEGAEVNPAFVEAISTDEQDAEFSQLLDDKAFETPRAEDGFEPDDVRFSMVKEPEIRQSTQDYYDKHYKGGKLSASDRKRVPLNITHFTQELLDAANAQIQELWEHMRPYLDMENKGKRFLPAEVYGQSTLFDNASYGKTMENTLICTRTLAYIDFVEEVKKRIGRPLTATESFLASQMLYDIAIDPQYLYCYVSLDRKAYDEFLLRYVQQRDEVIGKWNESDKSAEAKEALYKEFLNGRKPTSQMQARFESWLLLADEGNSITLEDLATKARRGELKVGEISEAWLKASEKYKKLKGDKKLAYAASEEYQSALWGYLASPVGQVTDAEAYAQSASWAKKEEDYRSYTGELLKCSADALRGLMGHYGLRFYSFSEYSPAFILENMQMVRDAAARGLKGFAYTKEVDFIKIFAPTGMNINCSVYGRVDSEGNVVPDTKQGADWEQVQALREQYPNVGAVFVATNDSMVEWALNQPWIDVIIPFHIVRTGADIAKFYDWTNYSSMQADVTAEGKSKYIFPHEHHNDKETFLALAAERGYKPRFADVKLSDGRSIVEHPNYMRLVNETRRSVDETPILTPTFNTEAAKESFDAFVEKGGYYSGYFVEEGAFEEGIETVVEDIKAGRTAKDVNYGRQDVPIDVAKIMAKRAEIERKHGKSIDLVEEAQKAEDRHVMMRVIGEVGAQRMDAAVEATTLMDNLAIAREMEEAGKDAKTIKMATGWERGADNKWRLEMEDFEFKAKPGKKKTYKLGDLIADEALFAAYPELRDTKVKYAKLAAGVNGQVTEEKGERIIKISEQLMKAKNPVLEKISQDFEQNYPDIARVVMLNGSSALSEEQKKIYQEQVKRPFMENPFFIDEFGGKSTLAHEIQHLIQKKEGFAEGGSESMYDTTNPNVREDVEQLTKVLEIEAQNANDLVEPLRDLYKKWQIARLIGSNSDVKDALKDYNKLRGEYDKHVANVNAIRKDLRRFPKLGQSGYERLAGEVEARNVARRIEMSVEERRNALLEETEDVARKDQIFLRDNVMMKADEYQASQELVPGHVKGQSMMSEGFDTVSFRITKNTKATIESWCKKANLEQDYTDAIIAYLDNTFEDTTEQLCAARWYLDGKISLPDEDEYKVRDAVKVAKQNKVDALSFSSPMEILDRFGAPKTKAKPINPDTVKEFSNKTELPEGIVVYDVQDDFEGQEAVRKIIDTHWGEEANPWCLAARIDGSLERAQGYWQHYSRYPKRIAFRNGKLLAFFASADKKTWWDRLDSPHENIPYSVKSKEGEYEVSTNYELKEGNKKGTQVSVGKSDGKGKTAYFVKGRLDSAGIQDGQRNLFYSSFPAGATLTDSVYGAGNSIEIQYGPLKNVTQISVERRPKDGPASYTRVGYNQNGVRNISFLDGTRSWDIRFGLNGDHIIVGRADLIFDQMGELDSVYSGAYSMNRTDDGRYEFRRGAKGLGTVAKGEKVSLDMLREFGEDGAPVGALLDFVNGMGWDRTDYPYANPADADILRNDVEVREMVQKAENDINEVAGKRYLATVNDVRFRFAPRTEEQREQLFETAKAKYGTTNNFNATGYMLPDGSLLDFSEANDGGDPNRRSLDHRDVEGIIMDEGREYELRYNYVTDFVAEGAIRMLPEYAGFQLSVPPTKEQRSRLMDYIYKHNGEVIMEITDQDGSPRVYMEYNKRTSPSRIFKDMDEFFNNGTTPGLPPLRFRVTNENQAIFVSNAAKAVEGIKMEKATPEQWLKMIEKNGGLKAGEDKWMGLSDWLKASEAKTLTKQEVLDFINENMIRIEEQHYEEGALTPEALWSEYEDTEEGIKAIREQLEADANENADRYLASKKDSLSEEEYQKKHKELVEEYIADDLMGLNRVEAEKKVFAEWRKGITPTRSIDDVRINYTTRGLYDKREIALTVPSIQSWNVNDEIHFGDAGNGRAIAWIRFGETYKYMGTVEAREKLQEFVNGLREKYGIEEEAVITQFGNANLPDELVNAISNEELYEFQELQAQSMAATDKTEKRILVIDEIQSKRHQEGRDKGYADIRVKKAISAAQKEWEQKEKELEEYKKSLDEKYGVPTTLKSPNATKEEIKQLKQLRAEAKAAREKWVEARDQEGAYGIPDAPFDKSWSELAMKRMLRYAAENGFDFVAWTKGDQQIERYRLAKDIKRIAAYRPTNSEKKVVNLYYRGEFGEDSMQLIVNPEGKIEMGYAQGSQLADVVGKDNAMKIMEATEDLSLEGDGLRVGGEGMRGFYDKMLPSFMNKYGKKWGVKVEDLELPNLGKSGYTMHSVPVTEEMKASVMEGQVMFRTTAITPEVQEEMDAIHASAIVMGNFMKAPNGKESNLNEEQWLMVRTKNFINWFGDWINDPENASKVVDENGEPKVVYHGRGREFNVFEDQNYAYENASGKGFYFTDDPKAAALYSMSGFLDNEDKMREALYGVLMDDYNMEADDAFELASEYIDRGEADFEQIDAAYDKAVKMMFPNPNVLSAFLNIRRPYDIVKENAERDSWIINKEIEKRNLDGVIDEGFSEAYKILFSNLSPEYQPSDKFTQYMVRTASQIKSAGENTGEFSAEDADIRYRVVADPVKIEELENGEKIKVYRAMQVIDGKLYPPMSAMVDGKLREPIELGQWEEAEERPDLADNKGYFKLNKGNKKSLKARYNPYFHTSYTPLNDQFSEAQDRPNLVTVEVEIPVSELTSDYKAEKAKDSVGEKEWKAGVIQGKLSGTRKVILSRWDKPVRIVPDSEVADVIVKMFEGKDITMPSNVVTPSLRAELEKRGVPFVETDNQGKKLRFTRENYTEIPQAWFDSEEQSRKAIEINGVEEITDRHFKDYAGSVILPSPSKALAEKISSGKKKVLIKKGIFAKNEAFHDFTPEQSRKILNDALYAPNRYGQTQPLSRPLNWVAIKTGDKNAIIVLEVNETKDYLEVVSWHTLDARNLRRIERQAKREGGEILILDSEESLAASLSALPSDLSSESKGSDNIDTANELEENISFSTGTPTEEVVAEGVNLSKKDLANLAGDVFAALPEESRKKITDSLNGNLLGLQDAIMQIPTSLAVKEEWNEEDKEMAEVVAEQMTKAIGKEMTRPFTSKEALWMLYDATHKTTDLISEASRALVRRNLGFGPETLEMENQAREDVRFRTVNNASLNASTNMYNKGARNAWTRLKESFVDMNASVEEFVKSIEKASGKVAQGFENILLALNQQSSKGLAAMESYEQKFLKPMFDEIIDIMKRTGAKYETVVRYVILKHGLERNKKLAQRDAKAHYQEIYDDIIAKIKSMTDAQKRTYLTNAQLQEADAKAELARLKNIDQSTLSDEDKKNLKKEIKKAAKAVAEAEEHLKKAKKVQSMSEQEVLDELQKIFDKIENGSDSYYQELRKNDYSGLTSMFYSQFGVDRKDYETEEEYQEALMAAKQDKYSTLADVEAAAEAEVADFENLTDTKELWKRINAATKETLRQQYQANMISKDQYESLRDMFEFYVPLRGFADNTAEDMYTYYRKPNTSGYTRPILGAEGRKTEAESPFGWIAAMAGSAIASNVKNEAKLALYYFVSNRPDNGIATISRTWFVQTGVDADGRKIFMPAYPEFDENLSSEEAKQKLEDWQENMRKLRDQGQAYESGQRLNLGNTVVNIDEKNKPEHIVTVKVAGKDYTIIINGNPRAAQAINGDLNVETDSDYQSIFGPVLRWMSSVNTSYNPEFWATNMMRDMAFTFMSVNIKEDAAYRRKFAKNYAKAFKVIKMVYQNENGTIGDSYLEDMYKDFVANGGVTGYTQIKDSEEWENEIKKYMESNNSEKKMIGIAGKKMMSGLHYLHQFGESLEQVSRFAAFLTSREMGKSMNEAINDAKEITVNFNRKGSGKRITLEEARHLTNGKGQPLNKFQQWLVSGLSYISPLGRRFFMFFNASIQGLNATYKLWKKNKTRAIGWALGYAAVGLMNALIHALMDDDDDYLDIPQYERRNSLMLGGNGVYFKWALPQEARAFYALGDLAVESVMGRNPHQNAVGEAAKILTEVLPVNPAEGWKAFIPSAILPGVELLMNEDYKGAPIYNEQKWLSKEEEERTARWAKAYQGTGKLYIWTAQALNSITGGDEYNAGLVNLQPEKIEHIVQSAFGGTIRTADKFVNTVMATIDPEEDVTVRQLPFLNRFLTVNDERFKNVHVNDVYDYYAAEAEHAITLGKKYTKARDKEAYDKLLRSDEYKWAQIYTKYKKPIKKYQDAIKVADTTAERMELMKQQDELKKRMIKEISEL